MISNREHQYRKVNAQLLMIDVGGQWRPCEMWHLHIIQCLVPYKSFKLEMITSLRFWNVLNKLKHKVISWNLLISS